MEQINSANTSSNPLADAILIEATDVFWYAGCWGISDGRPVIKTTRHIMYQNMDLSLMRERKWHRTPKIDREVLRLVIDNHYDDPYALIFPPQNNNSSAAISHDGEINQQTDLYKLYQITRALNGQLRPNIINKSAILN